MREAIERATKGVKEKIAISSYCIADVEGKRASLMI